MNQDAAALPVLTVGASYRLALMAVLAMAVGFGPVAARADKPSAGGKSVYSSVRDFGAIGDGVQDDTDAIQRAVDSAQSGTIFFPKGNYRVSRTIVLKRKHSLTLLGEGAFRGSTLQSERADGNVIEFQGCQQSGIRSMNIVGRGEVTAGYGVAFVRDGNSGCFVCHLEDVRMDRLFNGVHIRSSTETRLSKLHLRDLKGPTGVLFEGAGPDASSYRCVIDDILCDNPNGNRSTEWIRFDNWAYSLVVDKAALLNGKHGIVMRNTSGDPKGYPVWLFGYDIECDHNAENAVHLEQGEGFFATSSWFGSSLKGNGVYVGREFRGEFNLSGSRLFGNAQHGILIEPGPIDSLISHNVIGDNGTQRRGEFHGVTAAAGASRFVITSNTIGDAIGVAGNAQGYGVFISEGPTKDFVVSNNLLIGNQKGALIDGSTGGGNEVHSNVGHTPPPTPAGMTQDEIDAIEKPVAGRIVFNTTTEKHQGFDGTDWHDLY